MRISLIDFYLFLFLSFSFSCSSFPSPSLPVPSSSSSIKTSSKSFTCPPSSFDHSFFSIFIDGIDVGRELRSSFVESGPLGDELFFLSHSIKRMKMGRVHFESRSVNAQRTLFSSGFLLRASYVSLDQLSVRTYLVGFNGDSWDRQVDTRASVSDPSNFLTSNLSLSGKEVIGFRLTHLLSDIALGKYQTPYSFVFYEPLLDEPSHIVVDEPLSGTVNIDGQNISGFWVEASLADHSRIVIRSFFDKSGFLWVEEYPSLHEVRRRSLFPLSLPTDTSELLVGLHSDSYLADPNSATKAKFLLKSSPDRLDSLTLLSKPVNHEFFRKSPDTVVLTVTSGAPDGKEPPSPSDLGTSLYISPNAPEIVNALLFLKSSGKRGKLKRDRQYNATSVLARSSLIQNPRRFWKDPDKVAGLIMHFVYSILPDKRHTFSMSNSLSSLEKGAGDCTEHSVLFASLMRAQGIPTRLVSGLILTRGGMWGYHMWNSYWNGSSWQSIDPSTMTYRTGALHVALGRAVSDFSQVRDHLADFMWRTFSGVSFDLVEASRDGENLLLSRPRNPGENLDETALFNAVVLSDRGDHKGALELLDKTIPPERRSLSLKLMSIELLISLNRYDEALENIHLLRNETSSSHNTYLLDLFELRCLLTMRRYDLADSIFHSIVSRIDNSSPKFFLLKSEYLFNRGLHDEAISLLERALVDFPNDSSLLSSLAQYVSKSSSPVSQELLERALESAKIAARQTFFSDHIALSSLSMILLRANFPFLSFLYLDHALMLAPSEPSLLALKKELPSFGKCQSFSSD